MSGAGAPTPPEVSLIMPAWRPRADWLKVAVRSALDEDAAAIELIVVDDGSEPPVATLLEGIADPRLRVVRVEHRGPYAARDAGIEVAGGAFLRFVDADDFVEPGSTGRLLALAREAPEAIAYGGTLMCDEDLNPQRVVTAQRADGAVEQCVLGGFDAYVVSMVFPRPVVERAGRWAEADFPVSGDWDFVLRCLEQAPARKLDEVVTRYRRHASSITRTADVAAGARSGRMVLERYFERHPEQRGGELERRAYLRLHLDRAAAYAHFAQPRAAAAELREAMRRDRRAAALAAARLTAASGMALSRRVARRGLPRRPTPG